MNRTKTFLCALGLAGLTGLPALAATVETPGFLKQEVWFSPLRDPSIVGVDVAMLYLDPNYPNTPDMVSYDAGMTTRTVFPDNTHEQYGTRLSGWITPTVSGNYNFYLASDDASEFWISTDETEANLQSVAAEYGCCKGFLEPGNSQTTATPIPLQAGKKYAVQIVLKEGGGDDYAQVAWQLDTGTIPAKNLTPLVSTMLSSMADSAGGSVTITQQPANASTPENSPVTFTVAATAVTPFGQYTAGAYPTNGLANALGTKAQLPIFYQWFTNGVEVLGQNGTSYTIALPKMAQNGMKVKCYVAVPGVPTYSSEATLTVTADTTPPTALSAKSDLSFANVVVKFSEPVNDTALVAGNYGLNNGVSVTAVSRVDLTTVSLTTTKLAEGAQYTLTINNVEDTATPANKIAAGTTLQFRTFVFMSGTVLHSKYKGFNDSTGYDENNLFNDPRYRTNPDRMDLLSAWEYPAGGAGRDPALDPPGTANRYYMDTIEGYFIPPTTTNYVFFTCGADHWTLYLSTDENPANKHEIAAVDGWTDPLMWNTGHDTDMTRARSDTYTGTLWPDGNIISLTANKRYYMELVHYDPSWAGGDDFAANFKIDLEADPVDGTPSRLTGSVIGDYIDPTGATLSFTLQPQNVTASQGALGSFTAAAVGVSPYGTNVLYQWQAAPKGSSTWTNIPGAITATYKTPLLTLADDGTQFRVVASMPPITENSAVAILTVTGDTTPPVVSAGAMLDEVAGVVDVGIGFNETVGAAAATTLANYSVSSGTITELTLYTNRFTANSQNPLVKIVKQTVLLKVTGLTGSGSVTVRNIADVYGNTITPTTIPFTVDTTRKWGVVGANEFGGVNAVVPVTANGFDVYSDSVSEWATYDEATFVYEQVTGDFDKKVRVEYQDGSSEWARAGLVVREVTNFGVDRNTQATTAGRYQKLLVSPVGATLTGPGTRGAQDWELNRRLDVGGATDGAVMTGPNAVPQYPNAWCRIQRVGQTFNLFRSDDGVNWVLLGATTWGVDDVAKTPMAATVYVGPEYAPEIGNITQEEDKGTFLAQFREYGDYVAVFNPQLQINTGATGTLTITWASGTLVSSPTANGTYTAVPNAVSPYTVDPKQGAAMFYRVKR